MSTLYDAINMFFTKGDIVLVDNFIANQGDDAINLSSPVHEIAKASAIDQTHYLLDTRNHSQTLALGNKVAIFDHNTGRFLGIGTITAIQPTPGPGTNRVTVATDGLAITTEMFLRNLDFGQGRFIIKSNHIEKCFCHAFLAQVPNGLIEDNVIDDIRANAMKLITNVGQWKEGIGAFNLLVRNNVSNRTGIDANLSFPFGVISTYSVMRKQPIPDPANDYISIENNVFSSYAQNCISIQAAKHLTVRGNVCRSSHASQSDILLIDQGYGETENENQIELLE